MLSVPAILDALERHHGKQAAWWPVDPYEFLVWWHCGYPQSDERCAKGWAALTSLVGTSPAALLAARPAKLAEALKHGGMVPELRAERLKEIAAGVQDQFGGDLLDALQHAMANGKWQMANARTSAEDRGQRAASKSRAEGRGQRAAKQRLGAGISPLKAISARHDQTREARKILKSFPNIADPGADRILLFAGIAPIAAVPSNTPHVLVRILAGRERENYSVNYRESQSAIDDAVEPRFDARRRAYLLIKVHGQEICKRTNPKCDVCPLRKDCAYAAGSLRGRAKAAKVPGSRR